MCVYIVIIVFRAKRWISTRAKCNVKTRLKPYKKSRHDYVYILTMLHIHRLFLASWQVKLNLLIYMIQYYKKLRIILYMLSN